MQWNDACDASKSGQATRSDDEGNWTVWTTMGGMGGDVSRSVDGVEEARGIDARMAEQHDDWEPFDPIDAVTLLGDVSR